MALTVITEAEEVTQVIAAVKDTSDGTVVVWGSRGREKMEFYLYTLKKKDLIDWKFLFFLDSISYCILILKCSNLPMRGSYLPWILSHLLFYHASSDVLCVKATTNEIHSKRLGVSKDTRLNWAASSNKCT